MPETQMPPLTPPVVPPQPTQPSQPIQPPQPSRGGETMVKLQYPNVPVDVILTVYEHLTGKQLIRDANLAGVNLSISAPNDLPKSQAIRLIEASLLLNGYAFVPAGENQVKILNSSAKSPRSEGVTLHATASTLPEGETVASYFMQLTNITPDEALPVFSAHAQLHPYGSIVPVQNARALLITENSALIRQFITLRELIDVPPAQVITEFVQLRRANAERVAEAINKILEVRRGTNQTKQSGVPNIPPPIPGTPSGQQAASNVAPSSLALGDDQVLADTRTNRIILMTRPLNLPYLVSLVTRFDEAVEVMDPFERPLMFANASEILPVLGNLLAESEEDKTDVTGGNQQGGNQQGGNQRNTNRNSNTRSGDSGAGSTKVDLLDNPEDDTSPESITIGSTTLIADNRANSILVLGPPESREKVSTLLDKLDKRPMQVYLSTVIGQLTLGRGQEFAIDVLQQYVQNSAESAGIAGLLRTRAETTETTLDPTTLIDPTNFPLLAGLNLYGTIGDDLKLYVKALESNSKFRVLSRPTVYTMNNKKAVILSGQKVAVPTSTLSSLDGGTVVGNQTNTAVTSNIEYQDVVLKLEVIPLINSNREITLQIAQQNDSISGTQVIAGNTVPTISTQEITTTVTVPNRATIVLGGLITETIDRSMSGVPFLSRIPLLGYAFRSTKDKKDRTELIVLIQPSVVDTPSEILAGSYEEQSRSRLGQTIRRTEFSGLDTPPVLTTEDPLDPEPKPTPNKKPHRTGKPGTN